MRKLAKRATAVLLAILMTVEVLPAPVEVYADEPAPVTDTVIQEDAEPEAAEAGTTEPQAAETEVTEPTTTEPAMIEPQAAGTVVTEPTTTEHEIAEPATTEPQAAETAVTEPEITEVETAEPKEAEATVTEPATTEHATAEAETTEPQTAEDTVTEPETTEQGVAVEKAENAEDASLEEPEETDTAGSLSLETKVDDVTVKVDAEDGAFPEDAQLVAMIADAEQEKEATEAVDDVRPENTNVAVSYTFDIKIVDTEGNELQPEEGKKVNICFELDRAADNNLTADVYHIEETETAEAADQADGETDPVLEAEKLDSETDRDSSSVTAVTDGFSLYTVEFTYNSLQYVLEGGEKIALSTILSTLNLSGIVEAVEVSNTDLFSAGNETGEWVITSHKPFNTNEWMKVSIDGVVYEITVTDDGDPTEIDSWEGLQNFISNAENNSTAKLKNDITAGDEDIRLALTRSGISLTIDLDNHTINRNLSSDNDNNKGHVFDVGDGTLTIKNGTITGGSDENGGGIVIGGPGSLTLDQVNVINNKAENGGGIFVYGSLTMTGGSVSGNTADSGAGIFVHESATTVTLNDVAIENNNATDWGGGGINNKGTATLTDCTLQNNTAGNEGGGIYNGTGGLTLTNCTVTGNTAPGGGGICCFGTVNLTGTGISGNHASENGGGLAVHGTVTMGGADNSIAGNTASNDGGGIFLTGGAGIVSMTGGGTISDNTASDGGGVYNEGGTITFTGVTVSGNQSIQYGGAGINNKGTANLDGCTISANAATSDGAGIYSEGPLTITGSTFENNVTQSSGGALRVFSNETTLTGCTMKKNTASNYGGAICVSDSGTVSIGGGDTITENTAYNGGSGIWFTGVGNLLNITGVNTIKENAGSDIFLTDGKVITVTGPLNDATDTTKKSQIGVMLEKQGGVFTSGYNTSNSGVDPAEYFIPETGCSVIKDGDECKIIASKWGYIQYLINNSNDAINLEADITAASEDTTLTVPAGKNVTINLKGHKLNRGLGAYDDNGSVLTVYGTLYVTDTVGGGTICGGYGACGGVSVSTGGKFTIDGGSITGNTGGSFGGGIYVQNGGTATIKEFISGKGGRVDGNSAPTGGGIYTEGTLNIENGAVISNNNATADGGGIYIGSSGTVYLKGGSITGNTAVNEGGGIWACNGSLNASGSPVVKNNIGNAGNNILLGAENQLNITDKLTMRDGTDTGAVIDIASKDATKRLTNGLTTNKPEGKTVEEYAKSIFTYNGVSYDNSLEISNGELIHKTINIEHSVSSWSELYVYVNTPENRDTTVFLNNDIDASNDDYSIKVGEEVEGINITIDLYGHKMDRRRSDSSGDGNVIRVENGATLTITDSIGIGIITGGYSSGDGGAIYIDEGSLIMTGGTITGNIADDTGGAIYCTGDGNFDISNVTISNNLSGNAGGAFNVHNSAKISNSRIVNNKSNTEDGGAIYMDASSDKLLEITNTVIQGNYAEADGGGILLEDGKIAMTGGEFSDNSGYDGGGIMTTSDTEFTADGVSFLRNTSRKDSGGGVNNKGTTVLTECEFRNNNANDDAGAGVYSISDLTVTQCTFIENNAKFKGGAIFSKGPATIDNCTFESNRSSQGGGIYQAASDMTIINPTMTNNVVASNSDDDLLGRGGGIYIEDGDTTIDGGSITGNSADYCGSGIYVDDNLTIKGKLVVRDNSSDNVYLDDEKLKTGTLVKDETVTGDQIFVTLSDEDGTFTEGFPDANPDKDPADIFDSDAGYSVIRDEDGEGMIVKAEWPRLQKLINDKANTYTGSGDVPVLNIDRDWTALDSDVVLTIPEGKRIVINLNGHKINRNRGSLQEFGQVFKVESGRSLTIKDSSGSNSGTLTGGWGTNGGAIIVQNGATCSVEAGSITGNRADNGGAVYVEDGGTLTVTGGSIRDNEASNGGGIYLAGAAVATVTGGIITNNTATVEAGGIWTGDTGVLNVSGSPYITSNIGAVGKNILLGAADKLNITGTLSMRSDTGMGAVIDIASRDVSAILTDGLTRTTPGGKSADEYAKSIFTYNEVSYEDSLEVYNEELRHKVVNIEHSVSSWRELYVYVNTAENHDTTVFLANDIDASNDDYSIKVGEEVDGINITIDLNGHKMDRRRSSSSGDGNVIRVKNGAELTITDSIGTGIITGGNTDDDGGGIKIEKNSTCIINGGTITGNRSEVDEGFFSDSCGDGGGIFVAGTLIMNGGSVTNNYAGDTGGGIYCRDSGTFALKNATVSGNTSRNDGGGLIVHLGADASIENCRITSNRSDTEDGGGMRVEADGRTLTIKDTVIEGNHADNDGGGMVIYAGTVVMQGGSISQNTSKYGGGVCNDDGNIIFTNVTISGNNSGDGNGAGINNSNNARLEGCIITRNTCDAKGGGIYTTEAMSISGGEISYNSATEKGGGIFDTSGGTQIDSTTFSNNTAGESGGGIFTEEDLYLANCTLENNKSQESGGGICIKDCDVTLVNCTIIGNQSSTTGGGIYIDDDATLKLSGGLVTNNMAKQNGSGIYVDDDTDDVFIEGAVGIYDNLGGGNVYLTEDEKLTVSGALSLGDAKARIGVITVEGLGWEFTKGYNSNNSGKDPSEFFYSDQDYEVYLLNNEAAFREKAAPTPGEDPATFIDPKDQMTDDMNKLTGSNWMSGLSGERYLNEVNIPGTHDSGTKEVEGNVSTSYVRWITETLSIFFSLGIDFLGDEFTSIAESFARCQTRYIDEQLDDGIRRFDLRLSSYCLVGEEKTDNGEDLWIVHGQNEWMGTYYALNHQGAHLTFKEVLGWYKEFLKNNPSETILITTEAQGIDVDKEAVEERFRIHLRELSYEINPSTGEPYLYAEDGDYTKPLTRYPQMKECRGKMIFNINKGAGLKEVREVPGSYSDDADTKIKNLTAFYEKEGFDPLPTDANNGKPYFDYYLSAGTNGTDEPGSTPLDIADEVLEALFGEGGLLTDRVGKFIGLVNMDGENATVAKQVWITNFFDRTEYCIVTVKDGKDESNTQTFTQLKNTTITIPECIYKSPNDEGEYFQYWLGKPNGLGIYYPGTSYKITEDVTFTAAWDRTERSTIRAVWVDGDDIDKIRPAQLKVHFTNNRSEDEEAILTEKTNWRKELNYKASNVTVPDSDKPAGYEVETEGDVITLTHLPDKTINAGVTIKWSDDNNKYNKRPTEGLELRLFKNDTLAKTTTIESDEQGDWKCTIDGLKLYEKDADGNIIKNDYSLDQQDISDSYHTYISELNTTDDNPGFEIINAIKYSRTLIEGNIIWEDDEDSRHRRPGKVMVKLQKGGATVDSKVIAKDGSDDWLFAFDLEGKQSFNDYTAALFDETGNDIEGYTYELGSWDRNGDGKDDALLIICHLADCTHTDAQTYSVTTREPACEDDGEKRTFVVCPVCGVVISDTTEVIPALGHDWGKWYTTKTATETRDGEERRMCGRCGKTDIKVIPAIDSVTVNVKKVWDDDNNARSTRPGSVTFNLFANGEKTDSAFANAASGWKCSFPYLKKYVKNKEIVYTVTEESVPGYSMEKIREEADGKVDYTFTNIYIPGMKHLNVKKVWKDNNDQDGIRPGVVKANLYLVDNTTGEKTDTKQSALLSEDNGWSDSVNVYETDDFTYKWEEETPQGYTSEVTGDQNNGYTITNTHVPEVIRISGEKTWEGTGTIPQSITVRLIADGKEEVYKTVTAGTDGKWTYDFGEHPKYKKGGKTPITYTVREDAVDGWTPEYSYITNDSQLTANITNTYNAEAGKTSVSFNIRWDDENNRDEIRPDTVTVKLYKTVKGKDPEDTGLSKELTKDHEDDHKWGGIFTNLPKAEDGKTITYSVTEEGANLWDVDTKGKYKVSYSGDQTKGFTVTNKHTPIKKLQSSNIIIEWNDGDDADALRPSGADTLTVTLTGTADGKTYTYTKSVSEADGWKCALDDVVIQDANGNPVTYTLTVTGDSISQGKYSFSYTSLAGNYLVVTTHTPETVTITGAKTWDDDNDKKGSRPDSITVRLLKVINNLGTTVTREGAAQTVKANASNKWAWSFTVNKNEKGTPITYRVLEDYVPVYVTTYSNTGYDITNKYMIPTTPRTVTYKLNGGKFGTETEDITEVYEYGSSVTIHAEPVQKNWKFAGWKDEEGNVKYPGDTLEDLTQDKTYTAQWAPIPLVEKRYIIFNPNGGSIDGDTGIVYEYYPEGVTIVMPEGPEREGYKFLYWEGSIYYPGQRYQVLENHKFTARWEKIPTPPEPTPPEPTPPQPTPPGPTPVPPEPTPGPWPWPWPWHRPWHDDTSDSSDSEASNGTAIVPVNAAAPQVINPYALKAPDTADASKGRSGSGSGKKGGPDTGDESKVWLWILMLIISSGTLLLMARPGLQAYNRRKKRKKNHPI